MARNHDDEDTTHQGSDDGEDSGAWIGITALGALAGVAAYHYGGKLIDRIKNGPAGALSPIRAKVFDLLRQVVPSAYGDARFATMAPGYRHDDPNLPEKFSTCGYLPGFIGSQIGVDTRYGTEQVRTVGRAHGAWVEPGGGRRPKPGDFYALESNGGVSHVGVIVSAPQSGAWQTADAGQGIGKAGQRADYVTREWDERTLTLGGPAGARRLAGWYDIDKAPKKAAPRNA